MKLIFMLVTFLMFAGCSKDVNTSNTYNALNSQGEASKIETYNTQEGVAQFEMQSSDANVNFILPKGKMPNSASTDYLSIREVKSQGDDKKSVEVKGLKIILDKDSKLNIYNSSSLEIFKIEAKEIVVSEEFRLPGARLEIKAEKLVFIGNGKFITTPVDTAVIPEQLKDGQKGQQAGDIYVDAGGIDLGISGPRFILKGGRGQPAGYGIPGKAGKNVESQNGSNLRVCTTTTTYCQEREIGPHVVSQTVGCTGNNFPTDGEDAIPAGAPGAGGDGGNLTIVNSLKINQDAILQGPGDLGIVAPVTKGGVAGTPRSFGTIFNTRSVSTGFCGGSFGGGKGGFTRSVINPSLINSTNEPISGNTDDGKDAASPMVSKESSSAGQLLTSLASKEFSEKYLDLRLLYAKDLYRNYKFTEAESEFKVILELSSQITEDKKLGQVEKESMLLLSQVRNNKDIEGYALNFVPNLSMSKLVNLYKSEIDRAFNTLKFTSYFKNKIKSVTAKGEKIQSQIDDLDQNISLDKAQNSEAHLNHLTIEKSLSETLEAQKAFEQAMASVVAQIEAEARSNIHSQEKKKKLFGAIKLLANLAKVSPVGQPAAAAIGTSIDSVTSLSQDENTDWKDVVQTSYGTYEKLSDVDWDKSKSDWNDNYALLHYDKFLEKNPSITKKKFEAYMKSMINSTKPLYKATSDYLDENYKNQVPKSAYDKEIERIKLINPRFQEVTAKLSQLQVKKEKLNNDLMQTMAIIRETESNIIKSIQAISTTETDYVGLVGGLDFSVDDALTFYEKSAKDKLLKYKNYLIKSYSYRLLRPWLGSTDLDKMEKKLSLFATSDGDTIDLDVLKETYNEDLKLLSAEVFSSLATGALKEYMADESFNLNSGELAALKSGESIILDLGKKLPRKDTEENRRIISVEIEEADLQMSNESSVDFIFKHSGRSVLSKNGKDYLFVHENSQANWMTRVSGVNGEVTPLIESNIEESLFALFLSDKNIGNDDLKEHVGLESSLVLKLSDVSALVTLKSVRVKINYSFNLK